MPSEAAESSTSPAANGKPPASALTAGLIKWLESETAKVEKSGATSTRLALLGWAATIYASVPVGHALDDAPFLSLATSLSLLLNVVLDESAAAKETVRKSALVVTRRAVRTVRPEVSPALSRTAHRMLVIHDGVRQTDV